eukprot:jgi/Tetstr1/423951/TSEL_014562.t1
MTGATTVLLVLLSCLLVMADGATQTQLRVAVCLLGQVGRTELQTKVENLIKPNLADNVTMDILFKHARDWYNTSGEQRPHPITNEHIRRLPVIVKKCCSWGGYHDKTMLVPRAHMDGALNGPADEFYMIQKDEKRLSISNPETYIKYVMGKLKKSPG